MLDVAAVSRRVASSFARRLPSSRHLLEELTQEAACAILVVADRYRPGTQSQESFVWPYALKACQQHCAGHAGPVNRPPSADGYHGAKAVTNSLDWYKLNSCSDAIDEAIDRKRSERGDLDTAEPPDEVIDRKRADATVKELCTKAAQGFRNSERAAEIIHASMAGGTHTEIAAEFGVTRQRVNQILQQAQRAGA